MTADHIDAEQRTMARVAGNVLKPPEGGMSFGPFAAGLFPGATVDPAFAYFHDLYDRHTPVDMDESEGVADTSVDEEGDLSSIDDSKLGWERVAPGKGTPIKHAMVYPKDLAGPV